MKLQVERKPASLVVFDITADDDEFAEAMVRAVRKVSRDIQVPGFRKGKAPRSMVERLYGREIFLREAADDVMDRLYRDALKQEDITPVGEPTVEIVELEPVNFVVTIPVYPEIELGDYSGVRVDPVDAAVSDDEVEEVVERLRKGQSPWVEVSGARAPAEGDQVTIDYEVMDGDQPFQDPVTDAVFVLGETNLLTQLREKIEEMSVGDTATFELVFDEDDETADPTIRGKALSYKVTLKEHKERQMAELDDEFATRVAGAESMDDLRAQIREDIHQGKTTEARTGVVNQIIERMLESAMIDPPQTMIDEEVEHQLQHFKESLARSNTPYESYLRVQGRSEEDLKEELRPEAERRLRSSLLLGEIRKAENIQITDEEIDREIGRLTALMPPPADAGIAEADAEIAAPEDAVPDEPAAADAAAGEGDVEAPEDAGAELDAMADDGDELEASPTITPEAARAQLEQMRQLYQSDYFRTMLRNELYERKLTDRLIEIGTEGRGAVLNGWVAPEPAAGSGDADDAPDGETADLPAADIAASAADEPDPGSPESSGPSSAFPTEGEGTDWVAGNGTNDIPAGFPIKGNASSRIYHPVESPSYGNTIAEIYFATPEAAERFGYRLPKTMQRAGADAPAEATDLAAAAKTDADATTATE